MAVHPLPEIALQEEAQLVEKARQGDSQAFGSLVEPWRKPLFGYIYRMVTLRQDAEDLQRYYARPDHERGSSTVLDKRPQPKSGLLARMRNRLFKDRTRQ